MFFDKTRRIHVFSHYIKMYLFSMPTLYSIHYEFYLKKLHWFSVFINLQISNNNTML